MSTQATPASSPRLPRAVALRLPAIESDWVYGGLLAAVLTWIAIKANGGLRVGDTTTVEIAVNLAAGAVGAVSLLIVTTARRNLPGMIAAGTFALFVVASAVSTVWSVAPDQSWIEANRLVTYLAAFGAGMALVRLAPHRWGAVVGGITVACVAVSAWALMHKVFPASLDAVEIYSRLRQPFGYWNAVGLMAALGVPGCLWLGARRTGHAAVTALAYPATALLVVVLLLSYSRGSLLALVLGCAFWFVTVPLRLRAAAVLAAGVVGGGLVIAWTFSQVALAEDRVPVVLRDEAGLQLGIAMAFMLVALLAVGLAVGFFRDRHPLRPMARRRVGIAVIAALSLVPLLGVAKLATSERGLTGSITNAFEELTDPSRGSVTNEPGRLTAVASVRARYWNDALKIFKERPVLGVGVGGYQLARLRHRTDTLEVLHAHGYVVQVLADRGVVGLALSLAALIAMGWAIVVATGLRRRDRRALPTTPERVGLLTLTAMIVVFGVSSFVDWTWFIPGVALPVLLAGGWLAGRAGLAEPPPRTPGRIVDRLRAGLRSRERALLAAGAVVLALVASWAAWQPLRSLDAANAALDSLAADTPQIGTAREQARNAQRRNPLAVDPYFAQAAIERKAGNIPGARRALEEAIRLQPANPTTWTSLAEFQLHVLGDPVKAKKTLGAALYLDPKSVQAIQLLLEVNRTATATS
ncbi:MAG: O-antigen ligase family protein [Solirubrobacteraceae bacterium]